jgi:TPR repeat protein
MAFAKLLGGNNGAYDFERIDDHNNTGMLSPMDSGFLPQNSTSKYYENVNVSHFDFTDEKPVEFMSLKNHKSSSKNVPNDNKKEKLGIEELATPESRFTLLPSDTMTFHRKKRSLFNWFGTTTVEAPLNHVEGNEASRRNFTKVFGNANRGDADAQTQLGLMYYYGHQGVVQSTGDALYWLKLAALRNHHQGQINLGAIYVCMEDYDSARLWFTEAANSGSDWGFYHLGVMYYLGQITGHRESEQAFAMFKKAAKKWNMIAANNVGVMYMQGDGVMQNRKKALKWFKKAAGSCAYADHNLGIMYQNGISVEADGWTAALLFARAANRASYDDELCPIVEEAQHDHCLDNEIFLSLIQHRF